jgi:hypothetical protein
LPTIIGGGCRYDKNCRPVTKKEEEEEEEEECKTAITQTLHLQRTAHAVAMPAPSKLPI